MWTNDFIRVPFLDKGRSRTGSDCWGLVGLIYKELLGIELPSLLFYQDTKDGKAIKHIIEEECSRWEEIALGEEKEYDVAVFRMRGFPSHVGVVYEPGKMIHCERGIGTHLTDYKDGRQWHRRLVGFYRHVSSSNVSGAVQPSIPKN